MAKSSLHSAEFPSWYRLSASQVLSRLESKESGLSPEEVLKRQQSYGRNELASTPSQPLIFLFLSQFASPLIIILLISAMIIALLREISDSVVILVILIFNAVIGTYQEGKAQNTLESLKHFSKTESTVIRDGKEIVTEDTELVPGDIIHLQEGQKVPADARLLTAQTLLIDEASLTGESMAVEKDPHSLSEALAENLAVADQTNMVFRGTYVTKGQGTAIVVETGSRTMIGKIATEISAIDTDVPLKRKIERLSRKIVYTVAAFSIFFLIVTALRGNSLRDGVLTVISLCVALIPEGLPVILTLVLAMSVGRMSKRNALVKKLAAVEALGQASVIAVDKTGTITLNELIVQSVFTADDHVYAVTGQGYDPVGKILFKNKPIAESDHKLLRLLTLIASHTTNGKVIFDQEEGRYKVVGDPTEAALHVFGNKLKTHKSAELLDQDPFDYTRKYSAHLLKTGNEYVLTIIGAPESVLDRCIIPHRSLEHLKQELEQLSAKGLRVVAVGVKASDKKPKLDGQYDYEFLGFVAMRDSIHPEAKEAVSAAREAGIAVCMITGDHEATAVAIASEVGIYRDGDLVLTGKDIDALSAEELAQRLSASSSHSSALLFTRHSFSDVGPLTSRVTVFARVTPEHKLKIIKAFRTNKEVVAMTGDGVNDAASLVAADLGIAMGQRGTEVAKEAADIVLLDDNFKSITAAIREGRGLYLTLKNVILYLFSTSTGEAMTIAGALLLGFSTPILPVQILWLNFVTDGFLDVALSMEPREKGLLKIPLKKFNSHLIDRTMVTRMILVGSTMCIGSLFVFSQYMHGDMTKALTVTLTTLAAFQWFNAWNCRSTTKSLLQSNLFENKALIIATILIVLLHVIAVHTGFMQGFLKTTSLSLLEWVMCIGIASSIILVEEVRKAWNTRKISAE